MFAGDVRFTQKRTFTFSIRLRVRHFFHRSYNTAVGQLPSHDRRLAMPLQRGEVQGYNFNRMAVEFTMVNQGR